MVVAYALGALGTLTLLFFMGWTFWTGIGLWGNNIPVAWAFAITNFVWWIGIGHAGTFISAILLLVRAAVAHLDQSLRGGDDSVRGHPGGPVPDPPPRTARGSFTG